MISLDEILDSSVRLLQRALKAEVRVKELEKEIESLKSKVAVKGKG